MEKDKIKLSIITINRNNADGLRKTVESVLAQTYREFEYIIVDGASSDGSVEVINEYVKHPITDNRSLLTIIWSSEPDSGIYNAMNKGICMSHGEYVLMLNSGDYLIDKHVIESIIPELDGTDIIQGNVIIETNGHKKIERGYGRTKLSFIDIMKGYFLHQASFCRRSVFEEYGYFDESYRINGDTVFYAKCLGFGNASFKYVDINIAYFDMHGISADPENKWKTIRAEEDKRYMDMFSARMQSLLTEEDKKIQLYDKLHEHQWSWFLTMAIAHIVGLLHQKK